MTLAYLLGLATLPALSGVALLLLRVWWALLDLNQRTLRLWVNFGPQDMESYPEMSYGSIRTVNRRGLLITGYYRHGRWWESRWVGLSGERFGIHLGRKWLL